MRIISRRVLRHFQEKHPDSKASLDGWYQTVKRKSYENPHQVGQDFGSADCLGKEIAVFNIGGNKYRLVVHFRYDIGIVFIKYVWTHAEYDKNAGTLLALASERRQP